MLERTTKTETGRELKMWLEGRTMKATLEGLVKNHRMHQTKAQGYDVIDCGSAKHPQSGKNVEVVVKINNDITDFLEKAKAEIKQQEQEERNSELIFKVVEATLDSDWGITTPVLEEQKGLLSEEQEKKVEELRMLLGETALFAGASKYIAAKRLPVKAEETYTLTQILEMVKETTEYKAKEAREKAWQEKVENAKKEAKETGEKVKLYSYTEDCNDPAIECSTDIITVYITPVGETKTERTHTY
jgi:hypothetical protein